MANFEIEPAARRDMLEIGEYIAKNSGSQSVAMRFLDDLDEKLASYSRQPLMGTLCEDLDPDLRCFSFRKNYVVIYRPAGDGIEVLRMFHAARDYPRLFREGR